MTSHIAGQVRTDIEDLNQQIACGRWLAGGMQRADARIMDHPLQTVYPKIS